MSTTVVYGDASDATLTCFKATWADARGMVSCAVGGTGTSITFNCQYVDGGYYSVQEYCVQFDTTPIGTDIVSAAIFELCSALTKTPTTPGVLELRLKDWGTTVDTGDAVAGDDLAALTLVAHQSPTTWTSGTYYSFTDDALPGNINGSGNTQLMLNASIQRGSTAPTNNTSTLYWYSADEAGTTKDPKLTITHAAGGALFLMLEDGSGAYEKEDSSGGIVLEA